MKTDRTVLGFRLPMTPGDVLTFLVLHNLVAVGFGKAITN